MNSDSQNNNNSNNEKNRPKWLTANREFYPHIKDFRDEMKKEMTPAEVILWEHLRNKKMGVKFRRQHVIDIFIPDFVSLSIKLIIEVDGKIHLRQKKKDAQRTQWLNNLGFHVIRFKNEEVENEIEIVLKRIERVILELESPTDLPDVEE